MTAPDPSFRPSVLLIQKNPYAFRFFLIGHITVSITMGILSHSLIVGGVLLLLTVPFVLLATLFWTLLKALAHMIFFEL